MDMGLIQIDQVMALIARPIQQRADLGDESRPLLRIGTTKQLVGFLPSNSKFRFRGYFRWFGSVTGWVECGMWIASGQGGRMATTVMDWSRSGQSRNTT
jgi:hypothetical protein